MSLILDAVKSTIPDSSYNMPLANVASYAFITTVKTRRVGVSMTLSDDRIFEFKVKSCVHNMGAVEELGLKNILNWTESLNGIERSFAIAAINSAIELSGQKYYTGNALKLTAKLAENKNVAVVGHFPKMDNIKEVAKSFTILEKRPQEGDRKAEDAVEVLPEADVITVTGVTCLNDTLEGLLALKKPGAIFIVLGPTVPLSPVLFDFGVDVIGGAWAEDENEVMKMVAQGGTARHINSLRNILFAKNPELVADFGEEIQPPQQIL
ncbi:MAG: Rossmann-like domain-containing protein [Candidatus Rifleibacteriota bacterium]